MAVSRFDVYLVSLDPSVGSEIKKTRPCLVVSPDEMNHNIRTAIVAQMTTRGRPYPTRVPCRFKGKDVTIGDVFEGVGAHNVGKLSDEELHELECAACPSAGSCGGLFTANTMACVSEAIGLALPGSAGAPAPYDSRDAYAEESGRAVM